MLPHQIADLVDADPTLPAIRPANLPEAAFNAAIVAEDNNRKYFLTRIKAVSHLHDEVPSLVMNFRQIYIDEGEPEDEEVVEPQGGPDHEALRKALDVTSTPSHQTYL